jgi:tetratricopeptide (TPR) repeat protein
MNARTMTRRLGTGARLLAALLVAPSVSAEPSSTQRAAAEALFQRGSELMDAERYKEACEKFHASAELDPALGTMLYLADCYDRAGQTASAWALFQEASEKAKRLGQNDRERIARERAADLEKRLSLLELRLPAARSVPGLELRVNGVAVPGASINTPLPVDPGATRIEARAPNKKPWVVTVTIPTGPVSRVVELGVLEDLPPSTNPVAAKPTRSSEAEQSSNTQATLGYVVGAAGIAALVAGGVFAYRAYDQNRQSKTECRAEDPNACTPAGAELREDAKQSAAFSTIATAGGLGLVAGGVVIVLTAPPKSPQRERAAKGLGATLSIRGAF